jgi:hypothetical protein
MLSYMLLHALRPSQQVLMQGRHAACRQILPTAFFGFAHQLFNNTLTFCTPASHHI